MSYTDDSRTSLAEGLSMQESVSQVEERHEVLEYEYREQQSSTIEYTERRDDVGEDALRNGDGRLQETGRGTHDSSRVEIDVHSASDDIDQLEGTTVDDLNMPIQLEDWQESVTEAGEIDWAQLGNNDYTESRASIGEGIDMNSYDSSHQQYRVTSDNGDGEHSHSQESHEEWHENTLTGATDNWSNGTSAQEVAPAERIDASYFSDDDNGQNLELRELLSRRRVSNLLRSDFGESLDQLIQSYVERQGHASVEWELYSTSPSPVIAELYEEQQIGDPHERESDAVGSTPVVLPSPQFTPSQTTWDQEIYDTNWQQRNSLQHFGIEWEIINDLRIEITRLHQRMNCMQTMLEACMDMQLELQRSVRQEVSAALNRPSGSEEACEDSFQQDESKWDHVRKGICCVCCDTSIDSLLYRCGHMCTCSKCADKLVQGRGKCPMCRVPVVMASVQTSK